MYCIVITEIVKRIFLAIMHHSQARHHFVNQNLNCQSYFSIAFFFGFSGYYLRPLASVIQLGRIFNQAKGRT